MSCLRGSALLGLFAAVAGGQMIFPPQITSPSTNPATLPSATVGTAYTFTFTASNGKTPYTWSSDLSLTPALSWLTLNSTSGKLSGTPPANSATSYTFTVFVVDSETPQMSASVSCTLPIVTPPPVFQITTSSVPAAYAGSPYSFTFGVANGVAPYTYSLTGLPPALGLNLSSAGVLSGTLSANSAGTYTITLTVTDSQQPQKASVSKSFTLVVNPPLPPLRITTSSLAGGSVGLDYSQVILASGGAPPYTFAIVQTLFSANPPPPGLTLSPNGTLAGVPTKSGTYPFTVTVTDNFGIQAMSPFSVTISEQFLITTGSPLPPGTLGTSYSQMIAVAGGTGPYNFSVTMGAIPGLTLSANGLLSGTPTAPGTFSITIQVRDNARIALTKQFQITITASPPALLLSVQALSFTSSGGETPPPQSFSVFSASGNPVSYQVTIDGGSSSAPAPPWLVVRPLIGSTPARLTVFVLPGLLAAGTYLATIHITVPTDRSQVPLDIPVTLTVSGALPQLAIAPTFLRFAGRFQAPGILEQALVVRNGGVGGLSYSIVGKSLWVADITPVASASATNSPVFLQVHVNTQGLQPGSYRDVIRITSSAGSVEVPVTLFVAGAGPILGVSETGIRFQARAGAGIPSPQVVQVFNFGDPGLPITWTAALLSGGDWLSLGTGATGTATAAKPGNLTLSPNANVVNLPLGARYALIRLSDPNALNSPQYVVAVMDIAPASNAPLPDLAPAGLVFTTTRGAVQPPASQTVHVYTSSATSVPYQVAAATSDGASWLSVDSASGTASSPNPGQITVFVNPAGLSAGIYTAEISVAMSGTLRSANVTLIVAPAGGCSPARLALTYSGMTNNFSVPAGLPVALTVQLNDDCGAPVLNGSIVASFSNGDPPLSLAGDRLTGTYSATWQPGKAASTMTVTIQAAAGALAPASAQLIGGISPNSTPVLFKNGVVNNSSPLGGAALAPGTVAQVYGSGLATMTVSPGVVPLVTDFNGTNMLVGGVDAPLYYLSDGQLDVQIPFELAPNRQYAVIVGLNNAFTLPDTIDVVPVAPGVTAFPDGTLIAQHAANLSTLVDASHPARPGEILTIYLAGMGATTPTVQSALPAPAEEPFARVTVQPVVTVDGQNAMVLFAGLTPGGVGLYQINFQVPLTARSGILEVVVTQGSVPANTTRLLVVQ